MIAITSYHRLCNASKSSQVSSNLQILWGFRCEITIHWQFLVAGSTISHIRYRVISYNPYMHIVLSLDCINNQIMWQLHLKSFFQKETCCKFVIQQGEHSIFVLIYWVKRDVGKEDENKINQRLKLTILKVNLIIFLHWVTVLGFWLW